MTPEEWEIVAAVVRRAAWEEGVISGPEPGGGPEPLLVDPKDLGRAYAIMVGDPDVG